jgi:DNA (cytosine-5)-methyltransferase 1
LRNQFILDLHDELIIDNFAGGGGASTGIEMALGRHVDIAINHDREALAMHRMNHPQTRHLQEDVFSVDPLDVTYGRPVGLGWFSPDCKHFSKAKGGKPVSKKIRGLAWVAAKWAAAGTAAPRAMFLENVEEFPTWGPLNDEDMPDPDRIGETFQRFTKRLDKEGYQVEWNMLRGCDYGAPTIRRRFFLAARRDGRPIVWPTQSHFGPGTNLHGKQKPWRTAAECIDFSIPCHSIFLTKKQAKRIGCQRPLVYNSQLRIAKGIERHVLKAAEPFIISLTHQGGIRTESVSEPFRVITGAHRGEKVVVVPFVARQFGTGITYPANEPMNVVMPGGGGGKNQLIAAFLAQNNTGVIGHAAQEPFSTILSRGTNQSLVACSLFEYYGKTGAPTMREPFHTVTTKERHGLAQALLALPPMTEELAEKARRVAKWLRSFGVHVPGEFATVAGMAIYDIAMRMFWPRELFLAQGFAPDYIIDRGMDEDGIIFPMTKTAQTRMCGNSVCPPVVEDLIAANVPELIIRGAGRRRREMAVA